MIYQNLLQFIVSNYLNRGEAIQVLKDYALTREDAFGLITDAIENLEGINISYLGIAVAIIGILITIALAFIGYVRWESRKDVKEYEKKIDDKFQEYENKLEVNQRCLEKQESNLFKANSEIKKQLADIKKQSDKLSVRINLYHYYSEFGKSADLIFFAYINYVDGEAQFFNTYGELAIANNFSAIIETVKKSLLGLKSINKAQLDYFNRILPNFLKIPELKEEMEKVNQQLEKLLIQPSLNLPPGDKKD